MNKILFSLMCSVLSVCLVGCINSDTEDKIAIHSNSSSEATIDNVPVQESVSKAEEKNNHQNVKNSESNKTETKESNKSSDESNTSKNDSYNKGEAIKVSKLQELMDQDRALYAENSLTMEHIVSIKLKNLSADFKGEEYFIHISGENYKFEVNEVDSNFLTVVIGFDKITEKDLKQAEIKVY